MAKANQEKKSQKVSKRTLSSETSNILWMINGGLYGRQIAEKIGINKKTLYRWLKRMEGDGLIEQEFRDSYKCYVLTDGGRRFLSQKIEEGVKWIRLHNAQFKYRMKGPIKIPAGFRENRLRGHTDYYRKHKDVSIRLTTGRNPNFIAKVSNIYGKSKGECRVRALLKANDAVEYYRFRGFDISRYPAVNESSWHWAVPNTKDALMDKIIDEGRHYIQISGESTAMFDKSTGISEIEFQGSDAPEMAETYAKLPLILMSLFSRLERLENAINSSVIVKDTLLVRETMKLVKKNATCEDPLGKNIRN